jgi:hypothetical protein
VASHRLQPAGIPTMNTITRGTWVCVTLYDHFDHERPHRPAEDGMRGIGTDDAQPGDHPLFVLFKGRQREPGQAVVAGFLPLGRCYRADELVVIEPPA